MSLNYVAILYKSLHVFASKYHRVLPLISVCSSSPSNSSLLSQLALSRPHSRPCSSFTVDLASQHLDVTCIDQQTSLVIPPVAHLLKLHPYPRLCQSTVSENVRYTQNVVVLVPFLNLTIVSIAFSHLSCRDHKVTVTILYPYLTLYFSPLPPNPQTSLFPSTPGTQKKLRQYVAAFPSIIHLFFLCISHSCTGRI